MTNRIDHPLVGTYQQVFDADAWREAGGDVGDNSQFWRRAKIVSVRIHANDDATATVIWDHKPRTSSGHFINMMNHGNGAGEFKGPLTKAQPDQVQPWTGAYADSEETHHPAPTELTDDQVRAAMLAHFHSFGLTDIKIGEVVRTGPMSYTITMEADEPDYSAGTGEVSPDLPPAQRRELDAYEGLGETLEKARAELGRERITIGEQPTIQLHWEIKDIAAVELEHTMMRGRMNVQSLWVDPEYQNLGIGTAIMNIVLHEADQSGIELWLVPQAMPGRQKDLHRFYERLGFEGLTGSGYMIRKSQTKKTE